MISNLVRVPPFTRFASGFFGCRTLAMVAGILAFAVAAPRAPAGYRVNLMKTEEVVTTPLAAAYYRAHPDRFKFLTPADIPADIAWTSGEEQPEYASPQAKRGGTLNVSIPGYPNTLRLYGPNSNHGYRGYMYDPQLFAPVGFHPTTNRPVPELALSWAVSKDKRTCYYRFDPNARFADGQPITVDDYFFTVFLCTHPYTKDSFYPDWYTKEFESFTKYDDYTMAVTLPNAKPEPLKMATLPPTPRYFYRDFGPDFLTRYNRRFQPTAGPYVILPGDDVTEESITLTRIDNWWGDKRRYLRHRFNPDFFKLTVIREQDKAARLCLDGRFDLTMLLKIRKYWKFFRHEAAVENGYIIRDIFYNDSPRPMWGFYLNTSKTPLDNIDVRLGLAYATDYRRVIFAFLPDDNERMNQFVQGYGDYVDTSVKARPYDPVKALSYFAKAGYVKRGPDGILTNGQGRRLSFRVLIDSDGERKRWMAAFADSAKKAGVELQIEALERTTMFKQLKAKAFEIALTAWVPSGEWPELRQHFHSENAYNPDGSIKTDTNNITASRDPQLDALIDKFRELTDRPEMIATAKAMQRRIHELAYFIPGQLDPGYRMARWRWVRFPEDFDGRTANDPFDYFLFWIDEDIKRETEAARRDGKSFGLTTEIHDKFRKE